MNLAKKSDSKLEKKKAAKKENLEIRSDDIPEILQLIKKLQQKTNLSKVIPKKLRKKIPPLTME